MTSSSFAFAFGYTEDTAAPDQEEEDKVATVHANSHAAAADPSFVVDWNDTVRPPQEPHQSSYQHDYISNDDNRQHNGDDFGDFMDVSQPLPKEEAPHMTDDNDEDFGDFASADSSLVDFAIEKAPVTQAIEGSSCAPATVAATTSLDLLGDNLMEMPSAPTKEPDPFDAFDSLAPTVTAPPTVAAPPATTTTIIPTSETRVKKIPTLCKNRSDTVKSSNVWSNGTTATAMEFLDPFAAPPAIHTTTPTTRTDDFAAFAAPSSADTTSPVNMPTLAPHDFADFATATPTLSAVDDENMGTKDDDDIFHNPPITTTTVDDEFADFVAAPASAATTTTTLADPFTNAAATSKQNVESFADFGAPVTCTTPKATAADDDEKRNLHTNHAASFDENVDFGDFGSAFDAAPPPDAPQPKKEKKPVVIELSKPSPNRFSFYSPTDASVVVTIAASTAQTNSATDQTKSTTTGLAMASATPDTVPSPFDSLADFKAPEKSSSTPTMPEKPSENGNQCNVNTSHTQANRQSSSLPPPTLSASATKVRNHAVCPSALTFSTASIPSTPHRSRNGCDSTKGDNDLPQIVAALKAHHAREMEQREAKVAQEIQHAEQRIRDEMQLQLETTNAQHEQAMTRATQQFESRLQQAAEQAQQLLVSRESHEQIQALQKELNDQRASHQQAMQALQRKFETTKFQTDGLAYKAMQKLEQKEKEWDSKRQEYESEANRLSAQLSSLKESQQQWDESLQKAEESCASWQEKYEVLLKENSTEKTRLQDQAHETRQTIHGLRVRESKLSTQVENLERQLQASADSLAAACGNESVMEEALAKQKASYEESYKKMESRLTKERDALEMEVETLRSSFAEKEKAHERATSELAIVKDEADSLAFRETKLQQSLQKSQQAVTDWKNEVELREKLIERLRADLLGRDGELASMEKQVEQLEQAANCKEGVNLDYLKDVVVKYLSRPPGSSERAQLLPVLATILKFDANDYKIIEEGKQRLSWWGSVAPTLIASPAELLEAVAPGSTEVTVASGSTTTNGSTSQGKGTSMLF